MKSPNYFSFFAAITMIALLVGCAGQKEPAQQAVAAAESAVQSVAADAQKYLPARYSELTNTLSTLKGSFDKGDYKAVLAAAPGLMTQVKAVGEEAMAKKDEVMNALKGDWTTLASNLPNMVNAIQSRVDILSQAKKLPANISAQSLDSAKSGLDSMKNLWTQASAAFSAGDVESAVNTAKSVQVKGNEVLSLLGMTPS